MSLETQLDQVIVRFRLVGEEAHELKVWASQELRRPTDQVRYLLRREMGQRRRTSPAQDRT